MLRIKKLMVVMIGLGADANIVDAYSKTAYDYATVKKDPKSVLTLLRSNR